MRGPEVEEVPALLALVERAQLRAEELVEVIGLDGGIAREPARANLVLAIDEVEHAEVLSGVDLDLEPHRKRGRPFGGGSQVGLHWHVHQEAPPRIVIRFAWGCARHQRRRLVHHAGDVLGEALCLVARGHLLEEIAEPLRPWHGRQRRQRGQHRSIQLLGELREHGRDVVEPACVEVPAARAKLLVMVEEPVEAPDDQDFDEVELVELHGFLVARSKKPRDWPLEAFDHRLLREERIRKLSGR